MLLLLLLLDLSLSLSRFSILKFRRTKLESAFDASFLFVLQFTRPLIHGLKKSRPPCIQSNVTDHFEPLKICLSLFYFLGTKMQHLIHTSFFFGTLSSNITWPITQVIKTSCCYIIIFPPITFKTGQPAHSFLNEDISYLIVRFSWQVDWDNTNYWSSPTCNLIWQFGMFSACTNISYNAVTKMLGVKLHYFH